MKLQNQVPLKDTCLKLQAIGFEFDSYFAWIGQNGGKYKIEYNLQNQFDYYMSDLIPAPSVVELLDKIPTGIIIGNEECALEIYCHGEYCVWFNDDINFDNKNLAEALAQMLIWVKEKSYI